VFVGPFGVADLEGVAGRTDTVEVVAGLVTSGWVHRAPGGLTVYTVVRRFLADRGAVPPDAAVRHRDWLLSWAPAVRAALRLRWDEASHQRLLAAAPEIRRALAVADTADTAAPLTLALNADSNAGTVPSEQALSELAYAERLLEADSPYWPSLLMVRTTHLTHKGDLAAAEAAIWAAEERLGPDPEPQLLGSVWIAQGNVRLAGARHDEAERLYERAIAVLEAAGRGIGVVTARMNLAVVLNRRGDHAGAQRLLIETLRSAAGVVGSANLGGIHANLAFVSQKLGEHDVYLDHAARAEVLFRESGQRHDLALLVLNRSLERLDAGDLEAALSGAEEARALHRALGSRPSEAHALSILALARLEQGGGAHALELALEAVAILEGRGSHLQPTAIRTLAQVHLWQGRPERAIPLLEEAALAHRRTGRNPGYDHGFLALAHLATGDAVTAERTANLADPTIGEIVHAAIRGRVGRPAPGARVAERLAVGIAQRIVSGAARRVG
jgi:tetratricopeptide (TPR) repeat protein